MTLLPRYVLIASVSPAGSVHWHPYQGTREFADIWRLYLAPSVIVLKNENEEYLVTDMTEVCLDNLLTPSIGPYSVYADLDTAVGAAVLTRAMGLLRR